MGELTHIAQEGLILFIAFIFYFHCNRIERFSSRIEEYFETIVLC